MRCHFLSILHVTSTLCCRLMYAYFQSELSFLLHKWYKLCMPNFQQPKFMNRNIFHKFDFVMYTYICILTSFAKAVKITQIIGLICELIPIKCLDQGFHLSQLIWMECHIIKYFLCFLRILQIKNNRLYYHVAEGIMVYPSFEDLQSTTRLTKCSLTILMTIKFQRIFKDKAHFFLTA